MVKFKYINFFSSSVFELFKKNLLKGEKEGIKEAEFKEFESRLKFETRLKYCWFHLKLYSMF